MMTALSISLQSEEHQNQQPSNTARTGPGLMKMVMSMMLSPGNLILSRTTLKGEYKTMMSYGKTSGEFPFSKNELCILSYLASERISEMEDNFEEKDPHKYIELTQLNAKLNSLVWMMDRKGAGLNET